MAKSFVFNKSIINKNIGFNGLLKDINGVNGSPRSIAPGFPDLDDQMNQMGLIHFRCHDNLGIGDLDNYFTKNNDNSQFLPNIPDYKAADALSLVADLGNIRNIFPHAAKGMRTHNLKLALSEANYTMTDKYFKKIMDNQPSLNPKNLKRQIMFRIGRTNQGGQELPEDFDIYAALVAELVKRYSLNYQKTGLPRKISYWEIWNEPDLTFFWNSNDANQYYEFYAKVARMAKSVDPEAKVGGAGVGYGYNPGGAYLDGLLDYCQYNDVPIDFLSWHYYGNSTSDPQNIIDIGNQIQNTLNKYNYGHIESLCTEWNATPYANTNTFSKVQSAKNAAYIASSLMYMNHTKVDKSYYYRGDASSFGLFNDESGFCTYAAQAFYLYNKMFDTPNLLLGDTNFNSGLTALAGINNKGDKLNILAANFEVDPDFTSSNPPKDSPIYKQYYVDGNRQINKLTDPWSLEEWFGGVNPTTIHPDNEVQQKPIVSQLPAYGNLQARKRNYVESRQGIQLTLKDINYRSFKIKAWRIKEWGPLWSMTPADVSSEVLSLLKNNTLTLVDIGATNATVTLYSIEFADKLPNRPIQIIDSAQKDQDKIDHQ